MSSHPTGDLFADTSGAVAAVLPLAARMRPRSLDEFVGQQQLLGPGKVLRRALDADRITSLILYGPPGTGKTGFAHLLAHRTNAAFEPINATTSNVTELRQAIARARQRLSATGQRTILFIDEIHRFNKAQQDVLMPYVEEGNPILIGATTHNPFFSIAAALVSRSLVCQFESLTEDDIAAILRRALADRERGFGARAIQADDAAVQFLATASDGDARRALNALELAVLTTEPQSDGRAHLTREVAAESIQKKAVVYDHDEDAHYDTISAFIKSMRGSDPDATLYWLAKMLYAGEDPRFIARRIVICAAEDVGNADPQALVVAMAALQASEFVGLPECRIPLAQAAVYIACAPKSNAAYLGIEQATADVEAGRMLEVPTALRDASYRGAKQLGHGEGYDYPHDHPEHYTEQIYMPSAKRYYQPSDQGYEQTIKERLDQLRRVVPQRDAQAIRSADRPTKPPPARPTARKKK